MFAMLRRAIVPMLAVFFVAAAPPPVKTQAPGFFRLAVGSFVVTGLQDGTSRAPAAAVAGNLHGMDGVALTGLLKREFSVSSDNTVQTTFNTFLVHTGDHLILVDAGLGTCGGPGAGHLLENLKAAGYRAEDIDTILITHMHADHVCGLSRDGVRLFPNATVYASKPEIAYWLTSTANDPDAAKKKGTQTALKPYQAAGVVKGFEPGAQLFAGVTALDTRGHTPGHTSYLFQSAGQSFLALGDVVHVHAVQFAHPGVTIGYDSDEATARGARLSLFDRVAKEGWAVGGAHLPFPGVGHIRKDGEGFTFVRAEFGPLP